LILNLKNFVNTGPGDKLRTVMFTSDDMIQ